MALAAPPSPSALSQVERTIIGFADQLAKLEARAWGQIVDQLDAARKEAQRVLARAAAQAAAHPDDPGYAFTAERASLLAARVEDEYAVAVKNAMAWLDKGTVQATALGIEAANAAGGVYAGWVDVSMGAVENLVAVTQSGAPVGQLLKSLGRAAAEQAREQLVKGATLGWNPRKTAREMVRAADGLAKARALTIARTEMLRAYRAASQRAYRENQDVIGGWVWHSARDARTCAACWAMHGTVHPLDEAMAAHVNCRCKMVPLPDLPDDVMAEYVKALGDGPSSFAKLPAAKQRGVLGPARFDAYQKGDLALRDVVGYSDSAVWGRSVRVRPLGAPRTPPPPRVVSPPQPRRPTRPGGAPRPVPPPAPVKPPAAVAPKPTPAQARAARPQRSSAAAPAPAAATTPRTTEPLIKAHKAVSYIDAQARETRWVAAAMRKIPHLVPDWRHAEISGVMPRTSDAGGLYDFKTQLIRLRTERGGMTAAWRAGVAWHEYGHHLDHWHVRRLPAGIEGRRRIMAAIRQSRAHKFLQQAPKSELTYYLDEDAEWFARAYAQWVGTRTADSSWREVQRQIAHDRRRGDPFGAYAWDDDDYAPIMAEFDRMFRDLGWMA